MKTTASDVNEDGVASVRQHCLVIVLFAATVLPTVSGCLICDSFAAGYSISGSFVDADSGEPLTNVPVTLMLEGPDGLIGEITATTNEGYISSRLETDRGQVCMNVLVGLEAAEGARDPSFAGYLEVPPPLERVVVTLDTEPDGIDITVDITDEMVSCRYGVSCWVDLGTITVPADQ
jgi:hypothetical protein